MTDLRKYPNLRHIRLINKGAFFNPKMLLTNVEMKEMGIFKQGYKLEKVSEDTSRLIVKFTVDGEKMERMLDFTFLNY